MRKDVPAVTDAMAGICVLVALAALCAAPAGCASDAGERGCAPTRETAGGNARETAGGNARETASGNARETASGAASGADAWIRITERAAAELKRRAKGGEVTWLVTYNGTCAGAPALGFYRAYGDTPEDATAANVRGVELLIENQVADLHGLWGALIIDCLPQRANEIAVEFSVKEVPGWVEPSGQGPAESP